MSPTPPSIRLLVSVVSFTLLASAVILAWRAAESATIVGLLAAGVLLLILSIAPTLPRKFALGGGSIEWTGDQLVDRVYSQTIQAELASEAPAMGGGPEPAPEGPPPDELPVDEELPPDYDYATGAVWPGIEIIRQQARSATTAEELDAALSQAIWLAKQEAREVLRRNRPPPGLG